MQLEYIILADAADKTQSGKLAMLGGNVHVLQVVGFPALVTSLVAVVSLFVDEEECNRPHLARIALVAPDGENILPLNESTFTPAPNPPETAILPVRYMLIANLSGIVLPMRGKYRAQVIVDGNQQGDDLPLLILGAAPSGTDQQDKG